MDDWLILSSRNRLRVAEALESHSNDKLVWCSKGIRPKHNTDTLTTIQEQKPEKGALGAAAFVLRV
jgi:hypothetical protein